MKRLLLSFLCAWSVAAQGQETGCFAIQIKEVYKAYDRTFIGYPQHYSSEEKCAAALSKIKPGKQAGVEVIILKSCSPCEPLEKIGDGSGGSGSSHDDGGRNPSGSKPGKRSGTGNNQGSGKGVGSGTESGNNDTAGGNGASGKPNAQKPADGRQAGAPAVSGQTGTPTAAVPATPEQQLAQTLLTAAPGIHDAVRQYQAEQQLRDLRPGNYDTKPEGFYSNDVANSEWVNRQDQQGLQGGWQQELTALWGDVKDLFSLSSRSADITGYEQASTGFGAVSQTIGYLETAGRLNRFNEQPEDFNNRAALAQDAFNHGADFAGTGGTAFGRFGPPVDLYQKTFEGSLNRMNALLTTGDPGDEIQVTAPMADWFGSMAGMGNIGTRERNYRMERHLSFTELKNRHGYVEAAKQTWYNWLRQ